MILAVDTETTGTDRWHGCRPFLITACDGIHNFYAAGKVNQFNRLDVQWEKEELDSVQDKLESATKLIFHNAKFDLHMLESIGINLEPLWSKIEDTLLASHCLCSGEPHGLKPLAYKYIDYPEDDEKDLQVAVRAARASHPEYDLACEGHPAFPGVKGSKVDWYKMDYWLEPELCLRYGTGDVERTWLLWRIFYEAMEYHDLLDKYETRKKLIRIAFEMEKTGYNVYAEEMREEIDFLKFQRRQLTDKIVNDNNIGITLDLDSEKDKRFFLFKILKLEPTRFSEKTGVASISKDAIQELIESNPDIQSLIDFQQYRIAGTQIGAMESYLRWVCPDNRLRANMFITGTRNTRQSYTDPNLQSLDKRLHYVFGPPPGYIWLDFDLVNIELRIWVYQVGNKELLEIFESGQSVHLVIGEVTRPELFRQLGPEGFKERIESPNNEYTKTKNGTFGIIYGASEATADGPRGYGVKGAYRRVVKRFPEVGLYSQRIQQELWRNYEIYNAPFVTCLGGYRLDVNPADPYIAPNTKIQGSAGWFMTEAMINVYNNPMYHSTSSKMICQTHDSLKIEIPLDNYTPELKSSFQQNIEDGGLKYIPTCKSSCKVIYNEQDVPF